VQDQGSVERRLAAILAADVVGYSRLMGADELGTLVALKAHRTALIDPKIAEHRGRIVKTTGDGMLVEFASVVDAVRCAIAVNRGMAERNSDIPAGKRIELRIGINIGDIILDQGDIYGDGVNVAARLEGLAEPGGICVSKAARDQVRDKLDIAFEDMGEQALKNIARSVRTYRVRSTADGTTFSMSPAPAAISPAAISPAPIPPAAVSLALPDKPSIAILPFQNMSGDPEQEYFADGVVEDMITALSRFRELFVIARNSSFAYKGRATDVKQIGRELGVRYVLEGSVRKSANRVRITGQLVDTPTGVHIWADRFDGSLEDIFDLQDQVTEMIIGTIAVRIERAEIERAKLKPTENLDAFDYWLRGKASFYRWTEDAIAEALQLSSRAMALDPGFVSAYGLATLCYTWRKPNGWMADPEHETGEALRLARRAIELGQGDADALAFAGFTLAYLGEEVEYGAALIDRALKLNPNAAEAWRYSGWVRGWLGEPEVAVEHLARAMRLSPVDLFLFAMQSATAQAHFLAGHYDEAVSWAEMALRHRPGFRSAARTAAASHALAGRSEEAQRFVAILRKEDPTLRISNIEAIGPLRRPEDRARFVEGLRRAGVAE